MGNRNSFILYTDLRESLAPMSDEDVGKLLRAAFDYVEHGTMPNFDGVLLAAFFFLKTTLDRDAAKWEEERVRRTAAGKKGADARWRADNS